MCFKKDILKIVSWIDDISKIGREKQKTFLAYSLRIVRESLMLNYGDDKLVRLDGEELAFTRNFAPFVNASNCIQLTEELNKAYLHIERNINPKILFLDLSLQICKMLKK
ncbi:MAG: hypothetical protein ABII90_13945 [Bacteroidota bacterium]